MNLSQALEVASCTDPGIVRSHNEDSIAADATKGLVVLGFPANDFGQQEPGSNKDIARFCQINYGVSFPMFSKTSVSASSAMSSPVASRRRCSSVPTRRWDR